MEINKNDQYTIIKPEGSDFNETISAQVEKAIAGMYASEGRINFILDLLSIKTISDNGFKLFSKVQKIVNNEAGLWVLVVKDDLILDEISTKSEEFVLMLPTVDEAIDAVYMNELENDFKDEADDDYGFESENDY